MARPRFSWSWVLPVLVTCAVLALAAYLLQGLMMAMGGILVLAVIGAVVVFFGLQ